MKTGHRAIAAFALSGAVALMAWTWLRAEAGEPSAKLDDDWYRGHRIVDRHGTLMRELPTRIGARGTPLPLAELGDRLAIATLVSEDQRFFEHSGIDLSAVVRAVSQNVRHVRIVSGASTITQQLVKLLDAEGRPSRDGRGARVKLWESARAQNLEEELGKREILEAYLNRLNYGNNLIGPAEAARAYFGVSPRDLSWAQAALLAVLPRAPSYLDPHDHPERGIARQRALLAALGEHGFLAPEDVARSQAEAIVVAPIAHAFEVPYLTESLRQGRLGGLSTDGVTHTSIDLELQHDVEGAVASHASRLAAAGAANSAALVVDNETGEVLAYVGGNGWSDEAGAKIDMVLEPRQPGSTLKPFVYARAFEHGLQPGELVADVPSRFGEASGSYAPGNFDRAFQGPVSAREALAGSLNVPAVRIASGLADGELLGLLHDVGLKSLGEDASFYGLALALGSGEVPLWELAEAYVALARGGDAIELRVTAGSAPGSGRRVVSAGAAAAVADALSDPLARVRGLGGSGPFDIGFPLAVKTGTSSGYRDGWSAGFTRERTVVVWVGNATGGATAELTGGRGAGPLFADVMRRAMEAVPERRALFDASALEVVAVCPLSGLPVSDACPHAVSRKRIRREEGQPEACALHRHASPREAPGGEAPWRCDDNGAHTIVLLDDRYAGWLREQPLGAPGRDAESHPWLLRDLVPGCTAGEVRPVLTIVDPTPGAVLLAGGGAAVELSASLSGHSGMEVEFVLDGRVVAKTRAPYRAHVPATVGDHGLVVRPAERESPVSVARSRFSVR